MKSFRVCIAEADALRDRKAVLHHSMFFNNAKALVDPEIINFPRIIENIYNKEVEPWGKAFKKHLNKLQ